MHNSYHIIIDRCIGTSQPMKRWGSKWHEKESYFDSHTVKIKMKWKRDIFWFTHCSDCTVLGFHCSCFWVVHIRGALKKKLTVTIQKYQKLFSANYKYKTHCIQIWFTHCPGISLQLLLECSDQRCTCTNPCSIETIFQPFAIHCIVLQMHKCAQTNTQIWTKKLTITLYRWGHALLQYFVAVVLKWSDQKCTSTNSCSCSPPTHPPVRSNHFWVTCSAIISGWYDTKWQHMKPAKESIFMWIGPQCIHLILMILAPDI